MTAARTLAMSRREFGVGPGASAHALSVLRAIDAPRASGRRVLRGACGPSWEDDFLDALDAVRKRPWVAFLQETTTTAAKIRRATEERHAKRLGKVEAKSKKWLLEQQRLSAEADARFAANRARLLAREPMDPFAKGTL